MRYSTNRLIQPVVLVVIGACVCTGTGGVPGISGSGMAEPTSLSAYGIDRSNALVIAGGEPDTLDPAKWLSGADGIIEDVYSGLVRLDVTLEPVADLARDWDISADGTVYTFHLREGVTFHDGKPFTAADVVYSWNRAVSPEINSHTALTYMNDIVGVREVASGEAETISGVKALDDLTVEVTIDAPKAYFLHKLSMPAAWIVDEDTIDQIETHPNGTGPFSFERHDENEIFIMKRNPDYHLGAVALEYVVYRVFAGPTIRLYETGDVDMVGIDKDLVARAQSPDDPLMGNVQAVNGMCTDFVVFDVTQAPFDDPLVRRAFVMAVDSEGYNEVILEGEGVLTGGLYSPGMPGFTSEIAPLAYDVEGAKQALADSTYGSAENLPPISFTTFGSGGNVSSSDSLLAQMWQDALGVTVTLEGLDYEGFYDQVYGGNHGQIVTSGWCADYPDPENFAGMFATGALHNHGNYSNPDYDALFAEANSEADIETRMGIYAQIQQMLLDDAAAIFLGHSQAYYIVTKPYVRGYVASPIGVAQHLNMAIEADSE